jgi:hypothetical protein
LPRCPICNPSTRCKSRRALFQGRATEIIAEKILHVSGRSRDRVSENEKWHRVCNVWRIERIARFKSHDHTGKISFVSFYIGERCINVNDRGTLWSRALANSCLP